MSQLSAFLAMSLIKVMISFVLIYSMNLFIKMSLEKCKCKFLYWLEGLMSYKSCMEKGCWLIIYSASFAIYRTNPLNVPNFQTTV